MTNDNTPTPYNEIQEHITTLQGIFDIMGSAASAKDTKLSHEAVGQIIDGASILLDKLAEAVDTYGQQAPLESQAIEGEDYNNEEWFKVMCKQPSWRLADSLVKAQKRLGEYADDKPLKAAQQRCQKLEHELGGIKYRMSMVSSELNKCRNGLLPDYMRGELMEILGTHRTIFDDMPQPDVIDIMTVKQKQAA